MVDKTPDLTKVASSGSSRYLAAERYEVALQTGVDGERPGLGVHGCDVLNVYDGLLEAEVHAVVEAAVVAVLAQELGLGLGLGLG